MISNIILTTNNLAKAEKFYDMFFSLFGATKTKKNITSIMWKSKQNNVGIVVNANKEKPEKRKGQGTTIALQASSAFDVSLIHKAALRFGATCAGKPAIIGTGEHTAYFFDADNNKFVIFY
jgi:4-hydroxyphenylpyruvate dioxygenase-like putative hemolysin